MQSAVARIAERRSFWIFACLLISIAVAVSVRRLVVIAAGGPSGDLPELDALFASKQILTATHVVLGLVFALALPFQLSSRFRMNHLRTHRRLGRVLMVVGLAIGVSAYWMVSNPVGGFVEIIATVFYATTLLIALTMAWWRVRQRDIARHREWMLRAIAVMLGIATTRPVMAVFFATSAVTGLTPAQFFGYAFWIGFTITVMAAELYIRATRRFS